MIDVLHPGADTTVQGPRALRRAHLGIPLGGPADARSHASANRLVGNADDACALEMTLLGATLRFTTPAVIALCGAPFESNVTFHQRLNIAAGETVAVKGTPQGARCYLAVAGGIALAPGTRLTKGQQLPLGVPAAASPTPAPFPPPDFPSPIELRYTARTAQPDLHYEVTSEASRRGIRLAGPPLHSGHEIITEGVGAGTIQVPPSGQPVILFYDQTTTGGYPRLGAIIRPDLPRVGQLRPRDRVRLRWISWDEAALLAQHEPID